MAAFNLREYDKLVKDSYQQDLDLQPKSEKTRKYTLLIDSSLSASGFAAQSKSRAIEFARKLATEGYEVSVYAYSYKVDRLGDSSDLAALQAKISELKYRGPSVSDELVEFVNSPERRDQQIILFRDDSEHDLDGPRYSKQRNIDLVQLGDSRLHIYDMGERFNSLPQELLWLNLASEGLLFTGGIEMQSLVAPAYIPSTGSKLEKLAQLNAKLKSLQVSNRSQLAIEIFKAGREAVILTPFTAYIALETDWQKVMLDNLTDDFTSGNTQQPVDIDQVNVNQISFPESADYKLVVMLSFICAVLLLAERRQQGSQKKLLQGRV